MAETGKLPDSKETTSAMNYLKFPLGEIGSGTVVEVTLTGVESDVYILDGPNFAAMQRGGQFRYTGGHYKGSPVRLRVPQQGTWTAVVIPGAGGTVRASVQTIGAMAI
jgi:hypothetical protein